MKKTMFKEFAEHIRTCAEDDPVWWAGYAFLGLTECQAEKTIEILRGRFGTSTDAQGRVVVSTPAGFQFVVYWEYETKYKNVDFCPMFSRAEYMERTGDYKCVRAWIDPVTGESMMKWGERFEDVTPMPRKSGFIEVDPELLVRD